MKIRHIISSVLLGFLLGIPVASASYSDVSNNHEFIEGITYLELQGATDSAENFRPDNVINRAELFKILFKIFGEDGSGISFTNNYTDVAADAWFAPFAELAYRYELLEENSRFEAEKNIRRIDALEILLQAYGAGRSIIPFNEREDLFDDVSRLHPQFITIKRAIDLGVIEANDEEYFRPYNFITRGEFAELAYRFDSWNSVSLASENYFKSDIFEDIWKRIIENYYLQDNQKIDQDALFQAAVKGMLQSLDDPYSKYLSPDEASNFITALKGEFQGIGAILMKDDENDKIIIASFIENSPAQEAGLKAGDEITEVDGVSTTDMEVENIASRIKGEAGTSVTLKILRKGRSYTFTVTREELSLELETGEIIENDVWYIDIRTFNTDTPKTLMTLIHELEDEVAEPRAIVLDLRGNAGGTINSANFLAGLFLPQFTPLVYLDYGSFKENIKNGDTGPYKDYPLYILVNEFTASASEIIAATLQEEGAATIIGTRTFGKGTAQQITQFWDGSILKITIAEWLTGHGNSIQGLGITPDIEITNTSESTDLWLEEVKKQL